MIPEIIKYEIQDLCKGTIFKPHKYIALWAAIILLEKRNFTTNKIYYDYEFKSTFTELFGKYSSSNDRNRSYTPFFHLKTSTFWKLIPNKNFVNLLHKTGSIGGPSQLLELVSHVEIQDNFMGLICDTENRNAIIKLIESILENGTQFNNDKEGEDILNQNNDNDKRFNIQVEYLNTLLSFNANNENALAESQGSNPMFSSIHVQHPLMSIIKEELLKNTDVHIILTGHAGDGKSTIALELYK